MPIYKISERTYSIGSKRITVTDEKLLEIIEKAENLEIHPIQAEKELREYLNSSVSPSSTLAEAGEKMNLLDAIISKAGFFIPGEGRLYSLMEKYAMRYRLSGKFDSKLEIRMQHS
jgi:hypothetical protein